MRSIASHARALSRGLLFAAVLFAAPRARAAACTGAADCAATPSTPVCDPVSHQCVACLSDYQATLPPPLSCPNPNAPACQRSGILLGQCTQCSASNATQCTTADKPVCNTAKAACGCVSDTDCGSGRICDAAQGTGGTCVAGCRVVAGKDSCPAGQTCSAQDGGAGTCVTTTCTSDANCAAPAPKCDLAASGGAHCVQCIGDGDCAQGNVCDTSTGPLRGQCVPCTPGKAQNCTPQTGTACLPDDTCGCASDSDCGNSTSGRVCGPVHQCETGCRGQNGNGCPSGQVCTSTDGTIGQCVNGDGGAGDGGADGSASDDGGGSGDGGATDGGGTGADGGSGGDGGAGGHGADGGGVGADGGVIDDTVLEGGGCGCHVGTRDGSGALAGLAVGAAMILAARRRRGGRK